MVRDGGKCVKVYAMNRMIVMKIVPDSTWFRKVNGIFNLYKRYNLEYSSVPKGFKEYSYWLENDRIVDVKVGNCWCYIYFGSTTMQVMITKSGGYEKILEKVWKKFPMKAV